MMSKDNQNNSQQDTEIASAQERQKTLSLITGKNSIFYIIAVVIATAFFAHESVTDKPLDLIAKTEDWKAEKKKRTKALNVLKNSTIGTPEYNQYIIHKKSTDEAFSKLKTVIESHKFLEFKSVRQFLGEYGWAFGLLLYSLFNLIKTFIRKTNTYYGEIALHATLLYIGFFYLRWAFLREDYANISYVVTNLICVVALILATQLFIKAKERYLNSLRTSIQELISFVFKATPKNMEDEKWEVLKKVAESDE